MPDQLPPGRRLRFGVFELDLRAGELHKRGQKVRLQEQPLQVLALLLERAGEVVSREDVRNKLWAADTFVDFDHGLNKAINKIREALGDSAQSPRFVETVARRGYRFLADVEGIADEEAPPAPAPEPPAPPPPPPPAVEAPVATRHRRKVILGVIGAAVVVAATLLLHPWRPGSRLIRPIRSIAVLPLESLSSDSSQDYFADGMTDELISDLGQISALRVISRTSIMAYKGARKPLPVIARELDVDAVVEGTVLRSGDQVRITAQLILAETDQHIWSHSYDGELRDTLALQKKAAQAIADQIRIHLNPREAAVLGSAMPVNPEAYESYLKGRYFWNKRTPEGLRAALTYFNQAIIADPTDARSHSGLADTYALLGDWEYGVMPAKEALPKAKAAALEAIEIDGSLGEAHTSLAFCLDIFDWDLEAAGREFQKAIALNPSYATAHHWYAWHLALLGRHDDAIAEMKRAEALDPLSLIINAELAELFIGAHAYDDAIRQSRSTIEMDPTFALAHNQLGEAYLQKQMYDLAVDELKRAVELSGGSALCTANLARAYVAAGKKNDALALLGELEGRIGPEHPDQAEIAAVYVALGDGERALGWLEKGFGERFNPSVLLRPAFDPLRADPRFQDLVRRVGLPR